MNLLYTHMDNPLGTDRTHEVECAESSRCLLGVNQCTSPQRRISRMQRFSQYLKERKRATAAWAEPPGLFYRWMEYTQRKVPKGGCSMQ